MQRYADGLASPEEAARLEAALREDADLRTTYLEYLNIDAALESLAAANEPAIPGVMAMRPSRRAWPRVAVLAAAASLVGLWLSMRWMQSPAHVMADVVAADNAVLSEPPKFTPGERLNVDKLRLHSGSLVVRLDSGVKLEFVGPVEARFESDMRMTLDSGKLNADVGEHGKGFTVFTSAGEVVDLGTKFGVEADSAGSTEVVVFEGSVKVRSSDETPTRSEWTSLNTGDAVRMSRQRRDVERMRRIHFAKRAGEWSMASAEPNGVVADVRDNVTELDFRRYFGIVPGGMEAGAQPYSDQPLRKLRAVPGESFPTSLEGIDLVRTYSADRHDAGLETTLSLQRACTVYLLLDVRQSPPVWLSEQFVDSGERVQIGPWTSTNIAEGLEPDARGEPFVTCAVWKREVAAPGDLILGPPHLPGHKGQHPMYALAVGPLLKN
jgi:ferric-dicitrate binding protein FerR (iron transport regulator)